MTEYRLGGSSAKRWLQCHWSVKGAIPIDTTSEVAEEGTAVHAAAEAYLWGDKDTYPEQAGKYVEFCKAKMAESRFCEIEARLQHPLMPELCGTADFVWTVGNLVGVADYKNGRVPVEGFEQQLFYAALYQLKLFGRVASPVECWTFQPYSSDSTPVKFAYFDTLEVKAFLRDIEDSAAAMLKGSTMARVGDWCRYCKAAINCEEIRNFVEDTMKTWQENMEYALDALPIVTNWAKDVEAQARASI